MREILYLQGSASAQLSFHAPQLTDGTWNSSTHVSALINHGFKISVNENLRGKAPSALKLTNSLEIDYINQLLKDNIIERGETVFCVPHFFIYKSDKLRLIFNGKKLNKACKTPPHFNMKAHSTIANLASKYLWHAADDLSNMFFSIKINENCRKYFGVKTELGTFRYTSLPFGFSWSPFIAHIVVDQICKRAIGKGLKVTHYLDDFHYFADTYEEVCSTRDYVRELLKQANWQLNKKKAVDPAKRFIALGVLYDTTLKATKIPPRTITMLRQAHENYKHKIISRKAIAAILGLLVFFDNAVKGSLSNLTQLINLVKQEQNNWRKHYCYDDIEPYIEAAIFNFESMGWCPIQNFSTKPIQIYTDATPSQIAYIWEDKVKKQKIKKKQIYRAEADAIHMLLKEKNLPKEFLIRCDNMALVNAIKKGRSNIFEANRVCQDILFLRLEGHVVKITHIRTEQNPADVPSREPMQKGLSFETYFMSPPSFAY